MAKNTFVNIVRKAGASVLFIGYLPASGTFASALVIAGLWWFRAGIGPLHGTSTTWYWLFAMAAIGVSMALASRSRELFGKEDSGKIVIDEVAGQLVTFLFVPLTVRTLVLGFILFRFFDIIKPWPVYHMEELEDGIGVTMDDVAAGVLAEISILVILFVYHAIKAHL
jgi:phosphatidylglycerophosphatase A